MEQTRDLVIYAIDNAISDSMLIETLDDLIKEHGNYTCQAIFHVLTHLDLEPQEAIDTWAKVNQHYTTLVKLIGRPVSLQTAICDYFCSVSSALKNPKVVEINVFERTLRKSRYDFLTGLNNRLTCDEELERELASAVRHVTDFSIILFDLDDFKSINDNYGHHAGDIALKHVADILRSEKRTEDIAGRYGGEEFILMLPRTELKCALIVGERIRKKIQELRMSFGNKEVGITISGGLAAYPVNGDKAEDLVKSADVAMYIAKGNGKNNISLFSTDQRRFTRVDFSKPVMFRPLGFFNTNNMEGIIKNISIGGILFENDSKFEIGEKLQMSIPLEGNEELLVIGVVLRVELLTNGKYEIGFSFALQEMDKEIKKRLTRWIGSFTS